MTRTDSPVSRAFWQLVDLADSAGYSDTKRFALVWLAAGRMVILGNASTITSVDQLAEVSAWKCLLEAGFSAEAFDLVAAQLVSAAVHELGRRAAAAGILSELHRELGDHPWDVLPCLIDAGNRRSLGPSGTVVPELATLLLDLMGEPNGDELWIPFDSMGQLTVRALRRGWHVRAASPIQTQTLVPQLLLTIEGGLPQHPRVRKDVERDVSGRPITRANYALVMPPYGVVVEDSRMAMWAAGSSRSSEQFFRSESWAIHEFVNRTNKRAVFVVPPRVLFAQGQEQRLRQYLLHRGGERNELEAVIALPPGIFSGMAIAGAVLVVNPDGSRDNVRMVDLGSGRRLLADAGDIVEAGRRIALGLEQSTENCKVVNRDAIAENEYSFAPSRYLRRVADLGTSVVKLGDLCIALRPPTPLKEASRFEVAEVGMQDLNNWRSIDHAIERTTYLKAEPKDSVLVQPGDIIFSIKGTVGKAALMGAAARERQTVVSQSCLSLRLNPQFLAKNISTEFVLMYLKSPHGQAQLESLQMGGAAMQHISPSTLLSSMVIPVPTAEAHREVREDYDRLCHLERQVADLEGEIANLTRRRWSAEILRGEPVSRNQ